MRKLYEGMRKEGKGVGALVGFLGFWVAGMDGALRQERVVAERVPPRHTPPP